jgi:hypothetical protein
MQFPLGVCIKQHRNLYSVLEEGSASICPIASQAYIQVPRGIRSYALRVTAVHDQTPLMWHSYQGQCKGRHKAHYGTIRQGCPTSTTERPHGTYLQNTLYKIIFFIYRNKLCNDQNNM